MLVHKEKAMSERIFENASILVGEDLSVVEGSLTVRNGLIEEIEEGDPTKPGTDLNGAFIIPGFINGHTHLGDSVEKGLYLSKSQKEVVGSNGKKFKALGRNSDEAKIEAMKESLSEMKDSGTLAHLDFRENGIAGLKLIKEAEDEDIDTIILSRPTQMNEIERILETSDGIGLPSHDFLPPDKIRDIAKRTSKAGKLLSIHVSETEYDHEKSLEETGKTEIQRALELDPTFLVHGTWATDEDLRRIKEANVPLVLCSRSNSLLSVGLPPIKQAMEEGVELWLGTDNVSVCPPIMFQELSHAWSALRLQSKDAGSREARKLLKAATVNPADTLETRAGPIEEGAKASFIILSKKRNIRRCEDPYVNIVNRGRVDNVRTIFNP